MAFVFIYVPESCNVDCVREKTKQRLQNAMRTLRKSISKQQFYIQFSGTAYEVAQRAVRQTEGDETCSIGQVLTDGKCGEHFGKGGWRSSSTLLFSDLVLNLVSVCLGAFLCVRVSPSQLRCGNVLQRRTGTMHHMSARNLSGQGGTAVLRALPQHRGTGHRRGQERL